MTQQSVPTPPPRVILLAPMRVELDPIIKRLRLEPQGGVFIGVVGGREIVAKVMGVGAERAVAVLTELLGKGAPAPRIMLVGFGGALEPRLKAGDVPKLDWVIDGQGLAVRLTGGVPHLGHDADRAPGQTSLLSVGHMVDSVQAKRRLHQRHNAIMVDMESFAIAQFAAQRGLALDVLRGVSDTADQALPANSIDWVRADGSTNTLAAATWLFQRPWRLRVLLHLRSGAAAASASLAQVVAQRFGG